mmetsp:Transcript_1003/g.2793  ORF Transcript_1003/g.2793 Transcript_1003/m.2793 type:complete len:423 (+) Transcript_1003:56-1324(+)
MHRSFTSLVAGDQRKKMSATQDFTPVPSSSFGDEGARSRFTAREALNGLCGKSSTSPIRLLKASYLIKLHESGNKLNRRQRLPESAFWTNEITKRTHVIVLSYPWLSEDHPDPNRHHLSLLGPLLKLYVQHHVDQKIKVKDGTESNRLPEGDVAVFIDWACLFQKERTKEEQEVFKVSLRDIGLLYAHARTNIWCLTKSPPHINRTYFGRGWCMFEFQIASIITTGVRFINLGLLNRDVADLTNFDTDVGVLRSVREPPLTPDEFDKKLDGRNPETGDYLYKFTNGGSDYRYVAGKYRETYQELLHDVDRLEFNGLGWNDADARQFVKSLPYCGKLQSLFLNDNDITDEGARLLCSALPTMLVALDMRNNSSMSFSFTIPYPHGNTGFYELTGEQREERRVWRRQYLNEFRSYYSTDSLWQS